MGLFDRKFCDICGEKISLLGNRKLDDGNMCSQCAKRISPFLTGRRKMSVAEMKEHLNYREENRKSLESFHADDVYDGGSKKIYIDRERKAFVVTSYDPDAYKEDDPDIIPLSEVLSCKLIITENRQEEYYEDREGNRKSFMPPRYTYDYDFCVNIALSSRWFDEIEFKFSTGNVEGMNSLRFRGCEMIGQQIVSALTGAPANQFQSSGCGVGGGVGAALGLGTPTGSFTAFANQAAENARQSSQPQQPQLQELLYQQPQYQQPQYQQPPVQQPGGRWFCPNCGAENGGKFCTACGTPKP